jgi:amino acid transporter
MPAIEKKLGLPSAVAVCMGLIVATSCLVSLGQGDGLAGPDFVLPLVLVMFLNAFIAMSFSELHRMMPGCNGGMGQYAYVGLGPVASIISNVSAYVITMIFAGSIEITMCGIVLNSLAPSVPVAVFSLSILTLFVIVNLLGVDVFAKVQLVCVGLLIASMILFGVLAVLNLGTGHVITAAERAADPPTINTLGGLLGLSALAFWLYIGVEFVIPQARDIKNAKANVLLAMLITLAVLCVVQGILGVGMSHYVTLSQLRESDMPHLVFAGNMLGGPGRVWMAFVTVLASFSSINTTLPTTGRVLQGMADEGLAPAVFRKTNRFRAPWPGMILLWISVCAMIISGYVKSAGLINLLLAGSCFWLTSYVLIHLSVLVLRRRYPNVKRSKWLTMGGVPQVVGILGCLYMVWNISSDPSDRLLIFKTFGALFALLALYAAAWVGLVKRGRLFKPEYLGQMNILK